MRLGWSSLTRTLDRVVPPGSPTRKLLFILAFILFVEGLSVIILFSKAGLVAGLVSLGLGALIIVLLRPSKTSEEVAGAHPVPAGPDERTPGIRLFDAFMAMVGDRYIVSAVGVSLIAAVLLWNVYVSSRSELGDMDTLAILFGGLLAVCPFISDKYKVEMVFSLLFLGLVVLFLVIPQAVMSTSSDTGSRVGNWYVHYMLASPFAGILDLLGVPASSTGDTVTIVFQDGSVQVLGISAYCAGLYSFSIFLGAFLSFVLVFERLPAKTLVIVLLIGVVIAYLGNLFRMVIIGIVGYYRGIEALLWAHENVGWMIFLSWSAIFWYLLLGYSSRKSRVSTDREAKPSG